MNIIALRTQLMTEISLMPSDKLTLLAEFIRQLRVPLPTTPTSRQAIMRFAGCWNDMSEDTNNQPPRTELGQKLWKLRAEIVASGEPLLDWSGIEQAMDSK